MKAASDFTECKKTSSVRKETNRLREQISRLQLFYLMMWVILATGYLTLPFAISHFTQRDGWLVPIPFLAGIWLVFLLTLAFSRHFPRQTITEGLQTALGSLVGGFLSFILSIWFFIFICIVVRELVTFVDVTILPETPMARCTHHGRIHPVYFTWVLCRNTHRFATGGDYCVPDSKVFGHKAQFLTHFPARRSCHEKKL